DVARIGPDGRAVIAGRAQPGAKIVLLDEVPQDRAAAKPPKRPRLSAAVNPATGRGDRPRRVRIRRDWDGAVRAKASGERKDRRSAGQSWAQDHGGAAPTIRGRPCRSAVGVCSAGTA